MEHLYIASDLGFSYLAMSPEYRERVWNFGTHSKYRARRYYEAVVEPRFGLEQWELAQLFGGGN